MLVLQEAAEVGDQAAGPGDAEAGRNMPDEVVQPRRRVHELVAQVFAANEGATGVFLPAG
ncbi:hypothetical protein [Streptomyces radiopugnans]|uniref:hypothetical protein n=1 Tax=Streptomyces radiopugnans TaxID=403935 RepID=UPI001FE786D1|nr:hypothetical protein [Streptomyces radiopugnans]